VSRVDAIVVGYATGVGRREGETDGEADADAEAELEGSVPTVDVVVAVGLNDAEPACERGAKKEWGAQKTAWRKETGTTHCLMCVTWKA
jgi:hypothetical protein